jgi:hypothetical protein
MRWQRGIGVSGCRRIGVSAYRGVGVSDFAKATSDGSAWAWNDSKSFS